MARVAYLQVLLEVSGGLARRQLHIDGLQDTPVEDREEQQAKWLERLLLPRLQTRRMTRSVTH